MMTRFGSDRPLSTTLLEQPDAFLSLFPHRFDYIWAAHAAPGDAVAWQTESRYPLSDRHIRQGQHLYGVRFGAETKYCLLDIDIGSAFHPTRDRLALSRIFAALEPLGLVASITCTSSYSGGLHVYFPMSDGQKSWELAAAVATGLEQAGFKLTPGQLELFPNPKPYSPDGDRSLFNAHRLPLQLGSYLLNDQLEPIWSNDTTFVQQWQLAAQRNDLDQRILKQLLHQSKRKAYRVSGKADKFIQDLNTEIALGWTGPGQTNYLLGRIAMRTYIFHAVLTGEAPLTGPDLVQQVVRIARSLPGYSEWCRHQHELELRAAEWATCVESSRYFPYGTVQGKFKAQAEVTTPQELAPSWNQVQAEGARDRIRGAIAKLLEDNCLPVKATARFHALTQSGIGGGSLYRHRDLWHPNYLLAAEHEAVETVENNRAELPPDRSLVQGESDDAVGVSPSPCSTSLLSQTGGNPFASDGSSLVNSLNSETLGNNVLNDHLDSNSSSAPVDEIHAVSQAISHAKSWLAQQQTAVKQAMANYQDQQESRLRASHEAAQQKRRHRMQQFLTSGDAILIAEAQNWLEMNPEVVKDSSVKKSRIHQGSLN